MRTLLIFLLLGASLAAMPLGGSESQPPRDIHLVEKKFDQLGNRDIDSLGSKALAVAPAKWKHAETDNFIIHYRRVTEAQRVVREIEFDLWFVANSLNATKDRYSKKSHVYVFQDEREWKQFVMDNSKERWAASFAHGDDLYLHVGGPGEGFDSHILAHETTHAVVSRIYPGRHWPLWLNEGFAEYMGGASQAARKSQCIKSLQANLQKAEMPFEKLTSLNEYPSDQDQIQQLYQTGEKVVRFIMTQYPKDRFPAFVEAILGGATLETAVTQVYGDQVKDFGTFEKRYARFDK